MTDAPDAPDDPPDARWLAAISDDGADLEALAHELAGSDEAQACVMRWIETLAMTFPDAPAIARAEALLEHALVLAAERPGEVVAAGAAHAEQAPGRDEP